MRRLSTQQKLLIQLCAASIAWPLLLVPAWFGWQGLRLVTRALIGFGRVLGGW